MVACSESVTVLVLDPAGRVSPPGARSLAGRQAHSSGTESNNRGWISFSPVGEQVATFMLLSPNKCFASSGNTQLCLSQHCPEPVSRGSGRKGLLFDDLP